MSAEDIELQLAEWQAAKDVRDFETADRLREELRAAGHDPDKRRKDMQGGGGGRGGGGGGRRREPSVDDLIDQWRAAKSAKDFATADAIRDDLRSLGVEPDPKQGRRQAEPAMRMAPPITRPQFAVGRQAPPMMMAMLAVSRAQPAMGPYDRAVERELDNWEEAKSTKDFETADAIRQSLRSRGIDPERERTVRGDDGLILQWKRAKDAKDFQRSDKIRNLLRSRGVDPEKQNVGGGLPMAAQQYPMADQMRAMANMMRTFVPEPQPVPIGVNPNDKATKAELAKWFDAKDRKDFKVADTIREGLRRRGVEPSQCERPRDVVTKPQVLGSSSTEKLRQWFDARDVKDFETADAIRAELRANGIDPQKCERPHDDETTRQIAQWYLAKDQKDYATADAIRDELRVRGIEPSKTPRPSESAPDEEDFEMELAAWFDARDAKDFATADQIRAELRAKGIEPQNCARPGRGGAANDLAAVSYGRASARPRPTQAPYAVKSGGNDADVENQLDLWWSYKQSKNYAAADAIRKELRAAGIEPEVHRF